MESQNLTVDPGCLTLYDSSVLPPGTTFLSTTDLAPRALKAYRTLIEKIRETKSTEVLENDLRKLEHKIVDFAKNPDEFELPKTTLPIPRLLKYDVAKVMTKWEKFAKDRGIKKIKKRSRMIWSEELKDWVPRWGPDSAKHVKKTLDVIRVVC